MSDSILSRDRRRSTPALMTDLYQLTMAAAYFENGLDRRATFELFTRRIGANRNFLVACGLELALFYLHNLRFDGDQIVYLRSLPQFEKVSKRFWERLAAINGFPGDVWALPEGTPFFQNEPILRVTGPALEAQLVETYLLSIINQQTLIASKAARVVAAARGKHVSDFGTRRAHGPEAGQLVARAAYIAGVGSTSNVEAGFQLGIPVKGTFAHSWVMSFDDEREAFLSYQRVFPNDTTILLDTYDTLAAARKVTRLGVPVQAVRLDSGDLAKLSVAVRQILDEGGLKETKIVASGDLNEEKIDRLERSGAKIDVYGVGTELAVSKDMPALGGVYKLVEREGKDGDPVYTSKLSEDHEKTTLPGAKQIYRSTGRDGFYEGDVLALWRDGSVVGPHVLTDKPLLKPVLCGGVRVDDQPPTLDQIRAYAAAEIAKLPTPVRSLEKMSLPYSVSPTKSMDDMAFSLLSFAKEHAR